MSWEVANALSGVVTMLIALLVFREARSIRRLEWLSRSVGLWQDFNRLLIDHEDRGERWRKFLTGNLDIDDLEAADRHILLTYVNIIFAEWQYWRHQLLDNAYAHGSLVRNLSQLSPAGERLCAMLLSTGYEPDFVDTIRDPESALERSKPSLRRQFSRTVNGQRLG